MRRSRDMKNIAALARCRHQDAQGIVRSKVRQNARGIQRRADIKCCGCLVLPGIQRLSNTSKACYRHQMTEASTAALNSSNGAGKHQTLQASNAAAAAAAAASCEWAGGGKCHTMTQNTWGGPNPPKHITATLLLSYCSTARTAAPLPCTRYTYPLPTYAERISV